MCLYVHIFERERERESWRGDERMYIPHSRANHSALDYLLASSSNLSLISMRVPPLRPRSSATQPCRHPFLLAEAARYASAAAYVTGERLARASRRRKQAAERNRRSVDAPSAVLV